MADLANAAENDTDLHGDPDAMHWAQRFVHRALEYPATPMDEGTMLAWFAGAIETGRMVERTHILAELGHDHFVTFGPDGSWFMEHSAQCRLSGALATGECRYHQIIATLADPPESGRWQMIDPPSPSGMVPVNPTEGQRS